MFAVLFNRIRLLLIFYENGEGIAVHSREDVFQTRDCVGDVIHVMIVGHGFLDHVLKICFKFLPCESFVDVSQNLVVARGVWDMFPLSKPSISSSP
jgi:hypothetical protein